MKIISTN